MLRPLLPVPLDVPRFMLKASVVLALVYSPPLRFKVPYPPDKSAPGAIVCGPAAR